MSTPKISTDFHGFLEDDLLCLAHTESPEDHRGTKVVLTPGMYVIAYEPDESPAGHPEFLVASGRVERSPQHASHRGSVWSVRVDSRGIRHVPLLEDAD